MNKIGNKFSLTGDKFLSEMHLKQAWFTYSVCGPFKMNKERTQKFMQTGYTRYRVCFHNMAYRSYKDNVLRDKALKIASDPKHNGYERRLAAMVYKFFDKKSSGSGVKSALNQKLADELPKPTSQKV